MKTTISSPTLERLAKILDRLGVITTGIREGFNNLPAAPALAIQSLSLSAGKLTRPPPMLPTCTPAPTPSQRLLLTKTRGLNDEHPINCLGRLHAARCERKHSA